MRPIPSLRVTLFVAFLVVAGNARALVVAGLDDSTFYNRFGSGTFPTDPTATTDPDFIFAGLDLSGIGWRTASTSFGVTLITPRNFVTAAHVAPAVGASLSFLGTDDLVHTYTVAAISTLQFSAGVATDIAVGTLVETVTAADHVTYYPTLLLPTAASYVDLTVVLYGAGGNMGYNSIDQLGVADMLPFGGGNGVADSVVTVMDYVGLTAEAQAQGGDSGSPTFAIVNGYQLALVGVHSAINSAPPPQETYDSFLPSFYSQINAITAESGYSWNAYISTAAVPEPAATAVFAGLAATLFACTVRRRRARRR